MMSTSKLSFYYGVMNCTKTASLLMALYNAVQRGARVLLMKPSVDTRSGEVFSRAGLSRSCDRLLAPTDRITAEEVQGVDMLFVDECQFLSKLQVLDLRALPCVVTCYGLKTDYRSKLFPGSQMLLRVADSIKEIKTVCSSPHCKRKATVTLKFVGDTVQRSGDGAPDPGDIGKYQIYCWGCTQPLLKLVPQ